MKQFFTLLGIVAMGTTAYGQADTDIVNIPDANFKKILVDNSLLNFDGDAEISYGEARNYMGSLNVSSKNIASLVGVEAFVNITRLYCGNNQLTELDLSKNTQLLEVQCSNNQLRSLKVDKNISLIHLHCADNQLTSLDISKNVALQHLYCYNNRLQSLDVSKNVQLKNLQCSRNQLTDLDISQNSVLERLLCSNNQLTNLNVNGAVALKELNCYNNRLTYLDLSTNVALDKLDCYENQLTSLDVSKNPELEQLFCYDNKITSLDVSKNPKLFSISCYNNQLTRLNLANGNNSGLYIQASENPQLMCIQIDKGFVPPYYWSKDSHASYGENCNANLFTTEVNPDNTLEILNPVKDNLVIKGIAKVEKIEIYNTAGQLVKVLLKGNTQVQDLAKGIYLVRITTEKNIITEKIVKQ